MAIFEARAGTVDVVGTKQFYNLEFGYTLFEDVVDPADPNGLRAIVMHVPPMSMSRVWELVQPGYRERVELLLGSASLVLSRGGSEDWTTIPLTLEDPTAEDVEIACGDKFCIVTESDAAVVLSRPSQEFDISFERDVTSTPQDVLSRFIIAQVEAQQKPA